MPGNWGYLKDETKDYLINNFEKSCTVLDVGCGHGFYYKLLKDHFSKIDGVEIWTPYIEEYELEKMYNKIFNVNIMDFEFDYYDIIIMGDILEHLPRNESSFLLKKINDKCKELLVIVPYYLPQNEVFGNKYEIHLQPDLCDEIMTEYYPMLELICKKQIDVGDKIYYYCLFKKKKI